MPTAKRNYWLPDTVHLAPMETRHGNFVYCSPQTDHPRACGFCGNVLGYYRHPQAGYPACLVCGDLWLVDREYAPRPDTDARPSPPEIEAATSGPPAEMQAAAVMAAITALEAARKPPFLSRVRRAWRLIFG